MVLEATRRQPVLAAIVCLGALVLVVTGVKRIADGQLLLGVVEVVVAVAMACVMIRFLAAQWSDDGVRTSTGSKLRPDRSDQRPPPWVG